MTKATSVVAVT